METTNEINPKIGNCQSFFHQDYHSEEPVGLFGYFTVRGDKLEYCRSCYGFHLTSMLESIYHRRKRLELPFAPSKWFYFYQDEERNQAIENGKQKDYYHQQNAPYHKEIILLKEDQKINPGIKKEDLDKKIGKIVDVYIGDFGTRYCIKCSTKRNDETDKQLVMSLDNYKLCYPCGMSKALDLVDSSLIVKERARKSANGLISQTWNLRDKKEFSSELVEELSRCQKEVIDL